MYICTYVRFLSVYRVFHPEDFQWKCTLAEMISVLWFGIVEPKGNGKRRAKMVDGEAEEKCSCLRSCSLESLHDFRVQKFPSTSFEIFPPSESTRTRVSVFPDSRNVCSRCSLNFHCLRDECN